MNKILNTVAAKAYINELRLHLKGEFVRNVGKLASGTIIAQFITVISTPVLTRLFDPAAFGVLGLFIAITGLFIPLSAFRFDMAIVLPRKESDSVNLFALSIICVISFTFFLYILILFFGNNILDIIGYKELSIWIWFVPFAVFMGGVYESMKYWITRKKKYGRLSFSYIITAGVTNGTKISTGFSGLISSGLIIGQLIGQTTVNIMLGNQIWRNDKDNIKTSFDLHSVRKLVNEYSDFPKYNLPRTLISSLNDYAPVFLLAYFFSPVIVGFYAVTKRVIYMPMKLISGSFKRVFYQKASESYNKGEYLYPLILKSTFTLAAIGFVPMMTTVLFGPELFKIVLGENWIRAGMYAQFMIIWLYFAFIDIPCNTVVQIFRLQKVFLIYQFIALIFSTTAISIGGVAGNDLLAIGLFTVSRLGFTLFTFIYITIYSKKRGH